MEAATLLTMCSCLGLKGGCVTAVINVRGVHGESVLSDALEIGEANLIKASVAALEQLVAE
jgi:uridine phosphorylase